VALYAAKGARLHRKTGRLFVLAMVTMSLSGASIAALNGSRISIVAGLLTCYFVTTALLTVWRRTRERHWIDSVAMLVALVLSATAFTVGFETAKRGSPEAGPLFMFGVVGLLAAAGDLRVLRAGGIQESSRTARHLWRMCFAMWVAAGSFFWGPQDRVPEVIRFLALFPIPVLAPIVVMVYWLWRIRTRAALQHLVGDTESQASVNAVPDGARHRA
jgi:hypothetical protein